MEVPNKQRESGKIYTHNNIEYAAASKQRGTRHNESEMHNNHRDSEQFESHDATTGGRGSSQQYFRHRGYLQRGRPLGYSRRGRGYNPRED